MTEELSVDSINNELNLFLKSKARNLPFPGRSLVFKIDNKNNFKILDSDKKTFQVEEFFLQTWREVFTDKKYKYVKVSNWEFELELDNRKCNRIILQAENIVFIASKQDKKQLRDIAFRAVICGGSEQIQKLSKQNTGYIRRMIKRHVLKSAQNINQEFFSLVSFVKRPNDFKIQRMTNIAEQQIVEEHPLEYLTPQGRKIIEKLRNFISRQDVFDYVVRQQLSSSTQNQLKNIILAPEQKTPGQKKKKIKVQ